MKVTNDMYDKGLAKLMLFITNGDAYEFYRICKNHKYVNHDSVKCVNQRENPKRFEEILKEFGVEKSSHRWLVRYEYIQKKG